MAFMAAGRTRPKVSQPILARKLGACSLIEEINASRSPKTNQIVALTKSRSRGLRHERSISAAESRTSDACEGERWWGFEAGAVIGDLAPGQGGGQNRSAGFQPALRCDSPK